MAILGGIAAGSAGADTGGSTFLCYSSNQVDPGVWATSDTNAGNSSAATLLTQGYWLPFAEKSVPTATQLPGGWYLICNLQTGQEAAVLGAAIGGAGETITEPSLQGTPGYYPQAT